MCHDNNNTNNSSGTFTHSHTHYVYLFDLVVCCDCLFSAWSQIENICDEFHRMCVVIGIRQLVIVVKWDRTIRQAIRFHMKFRSHTYSHTHTFTYTKYWSTKRLKTGWTKTPSKTSITNCYQVSTHLSRRKQQKRRRNGTIVEISIDIKITVHNQICVFYLVILIKLYDENTRPRQNVRMKRARKKVYIEIQTIEQNRFNRLTTRIKYMRLKYWHVRIAYTTDNRRIVTSHWNRYNAIV